MRALALHSFQVIIEVIPQNLDLLYELCFFHFKSGCLGLYEICYAPLSGCT